MHWSLTYAVAYVSILALAAGIGAVTPIGSGNAIFLAGAALIFASLFFIRTGGQKALIGRTPEGFPIFAADPEARKLELRKGIAIFLVGAGLWAVDLAYAFATGAL